MTNDVKTIEIDEASDLARLLAEADTRPVRFTTGSSSYRVVREEAGGDDRDGYEAALHRLSGTWSAEDAEAAIEYLHRAREAGTRSAARP